MCVSFVIHVFGVCVRVCILKRVSHSIFLCMHVCTIYMYVNGVDMPKVFPHTKTKNLHSRAHAYRYIVTAYA